MNERKTVGYLMTVAGMEEFFKRVAKLSKDTPEARIEILKQMQTERKVFFQNEEQVRKRLKGKKVLQIKNEKHIRN